MVVIYGINKHLNPIKRELSEAIHACMQSVLGMPEKKNGHIELYRLMKVIFSIRVAEQRHIPSSKLI